MLASIEYVRFASLPSSGPLREIHKHRENVRRHVKERHEKVEHWNFSRKAAIHVPFGGVTCQDIWLGLMGTVKAT